MNKPTPRAVRISSLKSLSVVGIPSLKCSKRLLSCILQSKRCLSWFLLLIALDYSNYFVFRSMIWKEPPTPTPCAIVIIVIIIVVPPAWQCLRQHWRCILLPPPPRAMVVVVVVPVFLPAAGWRCSRILLPPPPHIIVFVPVFLPAAGQHRASTSTSHPTTTNAMRNLCWCCCPCPCPRCLLTSRVHVASSCRHRHVQSSLSLSSPTLSLSLPCCRYCHPCLPPCRRTMSTLHPTTTTATRDHLCPCIPPCRRSMLRVVHWRWRRTLPLPPPQRWQ